MPSIQKISLKNKNLSDIFFDVYLLASRKRLPFSLPSGKFVVRYRQLGDILKADTIDVHNNVDLGDIMLTVKEHTLNEVMITSQRRLFSQKAGKLVYLVQNSPFASGFNMRDMLHNIPRIDPTSDEIKILAKIL